MSSKLYIIALILLMLTRAGSVWAESVYVNDTLRVGVRSQPNSTAAPYAVVVTGMRLQVLDHAGAYIKIRNDKGVEGWIKDTYVSQNKPARLQLVALQAEQDKLKSQLASQHKIIKQDSEQARTLSQELQKLKHSNSKLRAQLVHSHSERVSRDDYYLVYLLVALLLVAGGFGAGTLWQRKRAMRRLGGLRV